MSFLSAAAVEGRHSDVEIAILDNLRHIAIEKRHNERRNMLSVDVGIGHNDYLMVAQLLDIGFFGVFIQTKTNAKCLNDVVNFVALESFVPHCLLDIQNFTAQR